MKKAAIYTIIKPNKPDNHMSGGFATINTIAKLLENIGYLVQVITPEDEFIDCKNFDLSVYADIFNDPENSKWFENHQYSSFLDCKKYIVVECAYTGCTHAPYGLGGKVDGGSYEPNKISEYMSMLMSGSKLNIFLSPLHSLEFSKFLGSTPPNIYHFFQPIDTEIFYDKKLQRDIPYLFVGALNWFKGLGDAIAMFGDKGLHIVGRNTGVIESLPKSIVYLGEKTPSQLSEVYNRTQKFVHVPRWQEPSARTVVEAALCGCELILNENVGVLSFGYDIRDPNISSLSEKHISEIIGEILNAK